MTPSIRPARDPDLSAIVEIYNHAITTGVATFDLEPVTVASRSSWFAAFSDDAPMFVASLEDRVVGFAYYAKFRDKAGYAQTKEVSVYVDPRAQGNGVGGLLLDTLVRHARARNVHVLMAALGGDNPASLALHERAGFTQAGKWREVGRKFGAWVDVTLLQKIL